MSYEDGPFTGDVIDCDKFKDHVIRFEFESTWVEFSEQSGNLVVECGGSVSHSAESFISWLKDSFNKN